MFFGGGPSLLLVVGKNVPGMRTHMHFDACLGKTTFHEFLCKSGFRLVPSTLRMCTRSGPFFLWALKGSLRIIKSHGKTHTDLD